MVLNSKQVAKLIRLQCLRLSHENKTSHLGGSLSVTDLLAVLYNDIARFDAKNPKSIERDRIYYSKGHAAMALYSCLEIFGFFSLLREKFTVDGSYFTSHVNSEIPGVEISTGSLGHALSVASGAALAGKIKNEKWRVFCILSDGELDEGSNWEAILFASHHKLKNLTVIIDYNKIQSFGHTNEVLNLEPLREKFLAFQWKVIEINGHDHVEIKEALKSGSEFSGPTVIIAHTIKGKGVSFMENALEWHYRSPTTEQLKQAVKEVEEGA